MFIKKIGILLIGLLAISTQLHAEPFMGFSMQETSVKNSNSGVSNHDTVMGITIGGLNMNSAYETLYLTPSFEISLDFGENTPNKLYKTSYRKTVLPNFSVNFPINNRFYVKIGMGMLWRNAVLEDGTETEEERIFNLRVGGGYRVYKNLFLGMHYDKSTDAPSLQIAYLFGGVFK